MRHPPGRRGEFVAGLRSDRNHLADDFVAGRHMCPVHRQVTFGDVQVGAAHPAGTDSDQHLVVQWRADGGGDELHRVGAHGAGFADSPSPHHLGCHATSVPGQSVCRAAFTARADRCRRPRAEMRTSDPT